MFDFCVFRIIITMAMQLISVPIIQNEFSSFPGYSNKGSTAAGFNEKANNLYTCLGLCLLHMGCNVVFYDNTTRYCSGTNDTNVETFVNSLIVRAGANAFRLASQCDSSGYSLNRQTGQCLKFVLEEKTWLDARQYCEDDGGTLLMIENTARFFGAIHMSYIFYGEGGGFFVGASDNSSDGATMLICGSTQKHLPTAECLPLARKRYKTTCVLQPTSIFVSDGI